MKGLEPQTPIRHPGALEHTARKVNFVSDSTSAPALGAPEDITLERVENQLHWYDRRSRSNRLYFKTLKTFTLIAAAVIPALPTSRLPHGSSLSGMLGILIAILESLQQLNQYQANWMSYRSTAEALEREKYYYLGQAGPYSKIENRQSLLADRVEALLSQENQKWLITVAHLPAASRSTESESAEAAA